MPKISGVLHNCALNCALPTILETIKNYSKNPNAEINYNYNLLRQFFMEVHHIDEPFSWQTFQSLIEKYKNNFYLLQFVFAEPMRKFIACEGKYEESQTENHRFKELLIKDASDYFYKPLGIPVSVIDIYEPPRAFVRPPDKFPVQNALIPNPITIYSIHDDDSDVTHFEIEDPRGQDFLKSTVRELREKTETEALIPGNESEILARVSEDVQEKVKQIKDGIKPSIKTLNADLSNYPTEIIHHPPEKELTFGDMHGNALKLIYLLVQNGVMNLKADQYNSLRSIYNKKNNELELKDIEVFEAILNSTTYNPCALVRLIGDELADRGNNDLFTLLVMRALAKNKVPFRITLSNHSVIALKQFHQEKNDRQNRLIQGQQNSVDQMWALLEQPELKTYKEKALSIVDNIYKPSLCLIDYNIMGERPHQSLTLFTHAPVGLETIQAIADKFQIRYEDSSIESLTKCIDAINERAFQAFQNQTFTRDYFDPDLYQNDNSSPFAKLFWGRKLEGFNHQPMGQFKVQMVHGHVGPDDEQTRHYLLTNLDNNLGKFPNRSDVGNYPVYAETGFISRPLNLNLDSSVTSSKDESQTSNSVAGIAQLGDHLAQPEQSMRHSVSSSNLVSSPHGEPAHSVSHDSIPHYLQREKAAIITGNAPALKQNLRAASVEHQEQATRSFSATPVDYHVYGFNPSEKERLRAQFFLPQVREIYVETPQSIPLSTKVLDVCSPSGQSYQFERSQSGEPIATLSQHEATLVLPNENPNTIQLRLAVTVMNMIDNIVAKSNVVKVYSTNPFVIDIAKNYIAFLQSKEFKIHGFINDQQPVVLPPSERVFSGFWHSKIGIEQNPALIEAKNRMMLEHQSSIRDSLHQERHALQSDLPSNPRDQKNP